jgi:hypothetical protein
LEAVEEGTGRRRWSVREWKWEWEWDPIARGRESRGDIVGLCVSRGPPGCLN